jgi:DNA polymerase-1
MEGLEADDVLGILATEPTNEERIIVSIDKDLLQIPGKVSRDGKTYEEISEDEANYWHMMQTLTGDSTDGYSGCPRVGVKTAQKILGDHIQVPLLDLWMRVLAAYAKVGYSTDEALAQARVARILRHNDYNKETGGIKLWQTS